MRSMIAGGGGLSGLPRPRSMRSAPLARTRAVTASVMTKPYGGSASARGKDQLFIGAALPYHEISWKRWTGRPGRSSRSAGGLGVRVMSAPDESPRDPGRGAERRGGAPPPRAAPEHGEPAERPRAHPTAARAQREELPRRAPRTAPEVRVSVAGSGDGRGARHLDHRRPARTARRPLHLPRRDRRGEIRERARSPLPSHGAAHRFLLRRPDGARRLGRLTRTPARPRAARTPDFVRALPV